MDEIISYKMCAVKVRNAKLRNYLKGFGAGAIVRACAFHLRDRGFDSRYGLMHHTYVKRVSQRSTESRGFSPFSSHREC